MNKLKLITLSLACGFVSTMLKAQEIPNAAQYNTIQVAILLDVSGSMGGLINQAKTELWGVVNTVAKAKKHGIPTNLEIAVYDYGKSSHPAATGYIRRVMDFNNDLDTISKALFALDINGGDEYCGYVIKTAVEELQWRKNDSVYKVIFIAGNEPFTQGSINYIDACELAKAKNIFINTIHCGNEQSGRSEKWADGASKGNGEYFWIDANKQEKFIASPYDSLIEVFNDSLNTTYWSYGAAGNAYKQNQKSMDDNNKAASKVAYYARAKSKANTQLYEKKAYKWDVVSKTKSDSTFIETAKDEELPDNLKGKPIELKKRIIAENAKTRDTITQWLNFYTQLRENFVLTERQKNIEVSDTKTLGQAIEIAIRKQAILHGFEFVD